MSGQENDLKSAGAHTEAAEGLAESDQLTPTVSEVSTVLVDTPIQNRKFVSGRGQFHTNEVGTKYPKPYLTISFAEIQAMVDDPKSVEKSKSRWFIPSTLLSRTFDTQKESGAFGVLWSDLDKDPKPLVGVCDDVFTEIIDYCDLEVYASRSAREDYQKGRVFVPLLHPLSGADWLLCQKVLNDKLEACGMIPDRKSEGCAQLCYLPNRGEFYTAHHQRNGAFFDPLVTWADEIEEARKAAPPPRPPRDNTHNTNGSVHDPVVDYHYEKGLVTDVTTSGDLCVDCPGKHLHSSDNGPSETIWQPAGTDGYAVGHFDCKHESCKTIISNDRDYLAAIGQMADGFDVIEYTPEEEADQKEIRERNKTKAVRLASAAIEKAKFTSGRDVFEQTRREYQKKQNESIGEGEHTIPAAEVITLADALNRFVFLSDGSRVADVFNPHYDLALSDWSMTYAASTEAVPQPDKERSNGQKAKVPDKDVPVSELWKKSTKRKSVLCRTFKAGGALVLNDPQGRKALNSWNPYDRSIEVADTDAAGLSLFLDHIRFLFGADADRFLDWLAHIEQNPGELPHTSWLHIAKNFGMGRNWLASVLTRVWAGSVAANLDMVGMMKSGFNDRMSRKVLAVVDEIREGGRDTQWEHSEKLKGVITEEHRTINPKYGRVSIEYNACRWLLFSQHLSAIPMEKGDRRIEVVVTEANPKPANYYSRLYNALNDPLFIAAVAKFLGERDITGFNPGAHAKQTAAKQAATKASQSPAAAWCELLVKHWPSDLITAGDLFFILTGRDASSDDNLNAGHRKTLEGSDIVALGKKKKIDGNVFSLSILRNKDKWMDADTDAIKAELQKARTGMENARDYLGGFEAESAD